MEAPARVRILHLSDTHSLHDTIEKDFPFPDADVLLHTGDITNKGRPEELEAFNEWVGSIRARFPGGVFVILGNHEWKGHTHAEVAEFRKQLTNCTLLHNEVAEVQGLSIYGAGWLPWARGSDPDRCGGESWHQKVYEAAGSPPRSQFDQMPPQVDILMTHGPAAGIFDLMEGTGRPWGSSKLLRESIVKNEPKVHLFGHLHEQRGFWKKMHAEWVGGVEYQRRRGEKWPENESPPPPSSYPCQYVSCNAMKNHPKLEHSKPRIAAGGRLIIATKTPDGWTFE